MAEGMGTPSDHYGLGSVADALGSLAPGGTTSPVEFSKPESRSQHFRAGMKYAQRNPQARAQSAPPASSATPLKVAAHGLGAAFKMKGI